MTDTRRRVPTEETRQRRKWTAEQVEGWVRAFHEQHGRMPFTTEMRWPAPSAGSVRRATGVRSLAELADRLGLKPTIRREPEGVQCEAIEFRTARRCVTAGTRERDGHRVCAFHAKNPIRDWWDPVAAAVAAGDDLVADDYEVGALAPNGALAVATHAERSEAGYRLTVSTPGWVRVLRFGDMPAPVGWWCMADCQAGREWEHLFYVDADGVVQDPFRVPVASTYELTVHAEQLELPAADVPQPAEQVASLAAALAAARAVGERGDEVLRALAALDARITNIETILLDLVEYLTRPGTGVVLPPWPAREGVLA